MWTSSTALPPLRKPPRICPDTKSFADNSHSEVFLPMAPSSSCCFYLIQSGTTHRARGPQSHRETAMIQNSLPSTSHLLQWLPSVQRERFRQSHSSVVARDLVLKPRREISTGEFSPGNPQGMLKFLDIDPFSLGLRLVVFRPGAPDHCTSGPKMPTTESRAAQTGLSMKISCPINMQQARSGCKILHL